MSVVERWDPPQAAPEQNAQLAGAPFRMLQISARAMTAGIGALVAILILVMFTTTYTRKVRVDGTLRPSSGLLSVVSFQSGVVSSIQVREGQWVEAGTPIATIAVDRRIAQGRVADMMLHTAEAQLEALREQEDASAGLAMEDRRKLDIRRRVAEGNLSSITARISIAERQSDLATETLEKGRDAHVQGYVSGNQYRQWQAATAAAQDRLLELRERRDEIRHELSEIALEARRLALAAAESAARTRQTEAALEERKAGLIAAGTIVLAAERTGRIVLLNAKPGEAVQSGTAIASILPQGAKLVAETLVPSKDVGFLEIGDDVRLMFDSFPYQQFGVARGRLIALSDAPANADAGSAGAAFRAVVALDRQSMRAHNRDWPLLPGMQLKADILLERRPLSEWLLAQSRGRFGG